MRPNDVENGGASYRSLGQAYLGTTTLLGVVSRCTLLTYMHVGGHKMLVGDMAPQVLFSSGAQFAQ